MSALLTSTTHRLRLAGITPWTPPPPPVARDLVGLLSRRPELRGLGLADVLADGLTWNA